MLRSGDALVMWRTLVPKGDLATCGAIPLALALHQHVNAPGQQSDFGLLRGHDIGQVIDAAHQVGDFFFDMFHVASGMRALCLRQAVVQ